jgi:pimeloyl-ACP methyl ester carboxylesterase
MTQKIANTAKGPIEYRLEGSGPTVMVLNGGHSSRATRLSHEQLTGSGFSVLTPSRPGYDDTPSAVGKTAQEAADALAALLDTLHIPNVDVIGISAAGPTALAFAAQHPDKIRKLVLESAVTIRWNDKHRRLSPLLFGRTERLTWGLLKLALRFMPMRVIQMMLRELTTLDPKEVIQRMSQDDLRFVRRMFETLQSGTGFINDIEHQVDDLSGIKAPVLVIYSLHDKAASPENAARVAKEIPSSELCEVPSDTHLLWIGKSAHEVWERRLAFLRS